MPTPTPGGAGSERKASRGTRLPDDFELTPKRRKVAEDEHLLPDRTFTKFCNYWRGKSGAGATKLDWDATWQNWCLKEADDLGTRNGVNGAPRLTKYEETMRRMEQTPVPEESPVAQFLLEGGKP